MNFKHKFFKLFKKNKIKKKFKTENKTLAEKLHESYEIQEKIENIICDIYKKYEPEIYKKLDFSFFSDFYDNSIEIIFLISLPYPYEPCLEIRQEILNLGFDTVYWVFSKDLIEVKNKRSFIENSPDEIRGFEPRHNRYSEWIPTEYGYVDERFKEKEWKEKYFKQ